MVFLPSCLRIAIGTLVLIPEGERRDETAHVELS